MTDAESPRPAVRVVLKRRDGHVEYTHVKLQNVRHVGEDGIERTFEPTGETNEQGLEIYREVAATIPNRNDKPNSHAQP